MAMSYQRLLRKYHNHLTLLTAILIALAFMGRLFSFEAADKVLMITASVIGFLPVSLRAFEALRVKTISIELLVSVAVLGAFIIGEFDESAIVTFLFAFGSFLERKTLEKTRSSIKELTRMAPVSAIKVTGNETEEISVDEVTIGDRLLVKTGAQVPVDGRILEGEGHLNEASVTGESREVKKPRGTSFSQGPSLKTAPSTWKPRASARILRLAKSSSWLKKRRTRKAPPKSLSTVSLNTIRPGFWFWLLLSAL